MAEEQYLFSFDSSEVKFNETANQNVAVVKVNEPEPIESVQHFLSASTTGIQNFLDYHFQSVTDVPKPLKVAVKQALGVPEKVLDFLVELEKVEVEGKTGFKAKLTAGAEVVESAIFEGAGYAVGSAVGTALTGLFGVAAAPAAGTAIILGIGGAWIASEIHDYLTAEELIVSTKEFANFISNNSSTDLKSTEFNLDSNIKFDIASGGNSLEPNDDYLVIPEPQGGSTVPLDENDRAVFLGTKPIQTVNYNNIKGANGVKVDLEAGTAEIEGINGIKDYLGNAIENVTGTEFDDTISGSNNDNILDGGDQGDFLEGKGGNDNLIGGSGNDGLNGGEGDDTLLGSGNNIAGVANEIDSLVGGVGADTFVLAERGVNFYAKGNDVDPNPPEGAGLPVGTFIIPKDFALLTDFNPAEGDKIQLTGVEDDYHVRAIQNNGLLAALKETQPNFNLGSLNPEMFSPTVLAKNGELIAVIPSNLKSALDVALPGNHLSMADILNAANFV